MGYYPSIPLRSWLGARRQTIDTLAAAHGAMGEVGGPGRPREIGRAVAHAYVLRVVAEFQAFVRDLHDLAAERMIELAQPQAQFRPLLIAAATEGRFIDRGNADVRSVEQDFRRLGIAGLNGRLQVRNDRWARQNGRGDRAVYQELIELRNALPREPGPARPAAPPRRGRHCDMGTANPSGAQSRRACLDRTVWDHLRETFKSDPW